MEVEPRILIKLKEESLEEEVPLNKLEADCFPTNNRGNPLSEEACSEPISKVSWEGNSKLDNSRQELGRFHKELLEMPKFLQNF